MADQLAGLLARGAQTEPVDHVVEAHLEVTEQVQAGHAWLPLGRVEVVAELPLEQAVEPPRLLLGAQLEPVVGGLPAAGQAVLPWREGAPVERALRVALLALQVELGALPAAEAADGAVVVSHAASDSPPLGRAAAVMRDRGHVGDGGDLEAGRLERADSGLAAGTRSPDEDLDRAHPVLHRPARGGFGGDLRREGRRLAAALEALGAGGAPGDHVPLQVGDGDDRVVEGALDVGLPHRDVLAFAAACADHFLLGHLCALGLYLPFLRRTPTVRFGPRRLRALVRVRWPRTGRPRRCRSPR